MSFDNSKVVERRLMIPTLNENKVPEIKDCRLVGIEKGVVNYKDKSGNDVSNAYIEFKFNKINPTDKSESYINDRIFNPIDRTNNPPYKEYSFEAEKNRTMGRIKHIQGRFMTPEQVNATGGETWDLYANAIIASFPPNYKEIPCKLSVVYLKESDGKYYPKLRKNPPFVSTETFPKEFSQKLSAGETMNPPEATATSSPGTETPAGMPPAGVSEI